MCKLILLLLLILFVLHGQKYPNCPQNIPIDTGNNTNSFYLKLISLTGFLQYKDDGNLYIAFYQYAKNGDQKGIQSILQNSKKFFIVIIAVLCVVSLSLLFVVTRMGDLQLTTKDVFQKLKIDGFSSPLSAFYAFVTVVLLASSCLNVYQIQSMIQKFHMTSCRLDALNQAYLNGAIEYNWDGVTSFSQKMSNLSKFSNSFASFIENHYEDKSVLLVYAQDYLQTLQMQYLGIVNNYNTAFIGQQYNISRRINLTTLIPNLFTDTADSISLMTPLTNYLNLLQQSLKSFILLQNTMNETADVFKSWSYIFHNLSQTLNLMAQDYSNDYINLRVSIDEYMSNGRFILIVCQVMSALTIFCTLAGLISLKLIQSNYDYFSLSSYKIIWAFHIFMLAANLVFLTVVSQVLIYNKGICLLGEKLVQNRSLVQQIYPKVKANTGMYYFYSCFSNSDFGQITQTDEMTLVMSQLINIKLNMKNKYNVRNIGLYTDVLMSIKETLLPYQFGIKGNISFIDSQLQGINNATSVNYQNQRCYKHHWVYGPQGCKSNQVGIIKPKQIIYLNKTNNYSKYPSSCYLLSDFSSYNPSAINAISFYQMYGKYNCKCPKTNAALASPINLFLKYFQLRRCVFGRLNDEIKNLSKIMQNTSKNLIGYIVQRNFLIQNEFGLSGMSNASELTTGKNCRVIRSIILALYNDFCINFSGSLRSIYLLAICNIAYILFMIAFSLLYAVQLRNLLKKDLSQNYSNIQFIKTAQNISSESASVLSGDESRSRGSQKSQSQKGEGGSKENQSNK